MVWGIVSRAALTAFFVAGLACLHPAVCRAASAPVDRGEFADLLRETLREHPDILLDVLRENSIEVLEVARQGSQAAQLQGLRARWAEELAAAPKKVSYSRPIKGNKNAPVTLIAYSDYTCPYCATANMVIEQVMAAREGKVRFIYKNYPLKSHPLARLASEYVTAALRQNEAKGWALHDAIFQNQRRFLEEGEGFLRSQALAEGLNIQKLSADMKSKAVKAIVDEDIAEATAIKATGTPYHLVNNLSVSGAAPLPFFLEAVDMALEQPSGR